MTKTCSFLFKFIKLSNHGTKKDFHALLCVTELSGCVRVYKVLYSKNRATCCPGLIRDQVDLVTAMLDGWSRDRWNLEGSGGWRDIEEGGGRNSTKKSGGYQVVRRGQKEKKQEGGKVI